MNHDALLVAASGGPRARADILDEILRTASENGGVALGRKRFLDETGIRESDWLGKYWTKWSDACAEAGVSANQLNPRLEDDALLFPLALLVRELRHFPVAAELKMKARADRNFPSRNAFDRFGRKAELARRLLSFCEGESELQDVAALCVPIASLASGPADEPARPSSPPEMGLCT